MESVVETVDQPLSEPVEQTSNTSEKSGKLSKEERSRIAKEAAAKRRPRQKKVDTPVQPPVQIAPVRQRLPRIPKEFNTALRTADKLLAKALEDWTKYSALAAAAQASIGPLQQTIAALKNQQNPSYMVYSTQAPVAYHIEPNGFIPTQPMMQPQVQAVPNWVPPSQRAQAQSPVAQQASGGAIDVPQPQEAEPDFLKDSPFSGPGWV